MVKTLNIKKKEIKVHQSSNILKKIRPYFEDMIDWLRSFGELKINLTMEINFMSSKDCGESQPTHSKSNNTEIMIGINTNEIINKGFIYEG